MAQKLSNIIIKYKLDDVVNTFDMSLAYHCVDVGGEFTGWDINTGEQLYNADYRAWRSDSVTSVRLYVNNKLTKLKKYRNGYLVSITTYYAEGERVYN